MLGRIRDEFEAASPALGAALFPELAEREKKFEQERSRLAGQTPQVRATLSLLHAQIEGKKRVIQGLIPELEARQSLIGLLVSECEEPLPVSEERRQPFNDLPMP